MTNIISPRYDYSSPKCDYDYSLEPKAMAYLERLKGMTPVPWYKKLFRTVRIPRLEHEMGADSFIARNPFDQISQGIDAEFMRILGREYDIWD